MSSSRQLRHGLAVTAVTAVTALTVASACSATSSTHGTSRPTATPGATTPPVSTATGRPTAPSRLDARLAPWTLPAARSREVGLAVGRDVVVAGGLSAAHVSTSTVWTLSPVDGRLRRTLSLPVAVHDAAGYVLDRTPYVVAGGNTTTVDDVQQITPVPRVDGHLPQPRSDLSAATVDGRGYVLGGFDGVNALSAVLRTTDGRRFTTVARLPVTVRYAAVADVPGVGGDHLLVFGGEHDGVPIDDVQDVDLTSGQSRIVGHLPRPLAHEAAVTFGDACWLVGGRSRDVLQSRIWRWDTTKQRATSAGRLPYAVADTAVAVVGQTAYVIGGETPEPTDRVVVLTTR